MTDSVELREQKLDAVIAEYYQAAEGGKTPDPVTFLADHAEFADELWEVLATVSELDRAVRPVEPVCGWVGQTDRDAAESSVLGRGLEEVRRWSVSPPELPHDSTTFTLRHGSVE